MKFALLICVVVTSTVTVAYKCCHPNQLESTMVQFGSYYDTERGGNVATDVSTVHYDFYADKIVTIDSTTRIINDFTLNAQYIIIDERVCLKADLPGTYNDFACIPDDGIDRGVVSLGGDLLHGRTYEVNSVFETSNATEYITVTEDECIPVLVDHLSVHPQMSQLRSIGFYNLTLGLKDPSLFDVPLICYEAKAVTFQEAASVGSDILKWVSRRGR
ncbi:ependymin-related protein 1-like [Ptychodera flava]|uniref:ependymin-related protein 1-like n=1 Tax=Ptychodera flava TaxID=63121 RepID=UPI00396A92ED